MIKKILLLGLIFNVELLPNTLTKNKAISLVCRKKVVNGKCSCKNFKFLQSEFYDIPDIQAKSIIYGNFVKSNEAIVTTEGCETKIDGWGGYIILRKIGNRWHLIKYSTPILGYECKRVKLSIKDGLICNNGYATQGYLGDVINLYTFDRNYKLHTRELYRGVENSSAVGENSEEYEDTLINSWKIIKKSGKTYVIIRANDSNRYRKKTKIILKEL